MLLNRIEVKKGRCSWTLEFLKAGQRITTMKSGWFNLNKPINYLLLNISSNNGYRRAEMQVSINFHLPQSHDLVYILVLIIAFLHLRLAL